MKFILLMMGLTACSSSRIDEKILLGTWRNTELKVKMNTFKNQDTTKWLIARRGQWEEVLKIKPIETTYVLFSPFISVWTTKTWVLKKDIGD